MTHLVEGGVVVGVDDAVACGHDEALGRLDEGAVWTHISECCLHNFVHSELFRNGLQASQVVDMQPLQRLGILVMDVIEG